MSVFDELRALDDYAKVKNDEAARRAAQPTLETENFLKAVPAGMMDALTRHLSAGAQAESDAMSQPELAQEIPQPRKSASTWNRTSPENCPRLKARLGHTVKALARSWVIQQRGCLARLACR